MSKVTQEHMQKVLNGIFDYLKENVYDTDLDIEHISVFNYFVFKAMTHKILELASIADIEEVLTMLKDELNEIYSEIKDTKSKEFIPMDLPESSIVFKIYKIASESEANSYFPEDLESNIREIKELIETSYKVKES